MTQFNITIPPDFIDKFVWPPSKDIAADGTAEPKNVLSSDHPALPQSYTFSDGIVSGVLGAAICALSPASQLGGMELSEFLSLNHDEDLPEEPSICLFTPYEGCHEIIDSMIQSVANQLNADVVVLDALELALGEFGVLGTDIGRAISDVYEPKPKLDSSRIQAAFDAIVTVSNKVQPCTGVDLTEASKRRFIYLRDFGSIARSAKPFMARLLHAIRVRRSAAYENEHHSGACGILHPTVLLMGFDKAFNSCSCCWALPIRWDPATFSEGGQALRETLPALDSRSFYLEERRSEIRLKVLPAAFFLPLVPKSSEVKTTPLSLAQNSVIPALREECICLIPRNFQQSAIRDLTRCAKIKRRIDVQNMLFVLFLRQQGFLVVEDLNSAMSADTSSGGANPNNALWSDVLGDRPDIPLPIAVSRIVTIAIGLAHQRPHAQTPIRIAAEDISKAHAIFVENSRTFSHWVDEVKSRQKPEVKQDMSDDESSDAEQTSTASEKNSAGASEEENKDTIVECVKNCKDLNKHEEALLPCIIDCGILARESIGGVLLYGPPGTGKTMVCRALARESGVRMLQVRPSDVMNKWVGESEKLAQNVFVTEFLQAMDGLKSARKNRDAGVVVVGATNRPFDLDEAVLRRLPTRLLVKLPDETRRKDTSEILQVHLRGEAFPDVQLDEIARRTHGYSGSDLKSQDVSSYGGQGLINRGSEGLGDECHHRWDCSSRQKIRRTKSGPWSKTL
ncbi:hypothetical protein B0H13DRAFT_1912976 [Mycena leptocephala]|nr:hypothetical protein B0H13DRAFT_1912976 [Mycena leptocephala]